MQIRRYHQIISLFSVLIDVLTQQQIEKDNSFIYLEIVPKIENLATINGAVIAKPKAFNEQERLSPKFHGQLFT